MTGLPLHTNLRSNRWERNLSCAPRALTKAKLRRSCRISWWKQKGLLPQWSTTAGIQSSWAWVGRPTRPMERGRCFSRSTMRHSWRPNSLANSRWESPRSWPSYINLPPRESRSPFLLWTQLRKRKVSRTAIKWSSKAISQRTLSECLSAPSKRSSRSSFFAKKASNHWGLF